MTEPGKSFGEFVRRKRLSEQITLRLFAQLLEISPPFLSDLENDNRYPPDNRVLEKMVEVLNLSPEEQEEFYDLAGRGRHVIAPDLPDYINENKIVRTALRRVKDKATPEDWQKFIDSVEGKDKK